MARILIGNLGLEIADHLKEILEEGKNELFFAGTDEEIISRLQNDSYDLIILDVINPEKRIHQLIQKVKRLDEYLPILLVGGLPLNPSIFNVKYPSGNIYAVEAYCNSHYCFLIMPASTSSRSLISPTGLLQT